MKNLARPFAFVLALALMIEIFQVVTWPRSSFAAKFANQFAEFELPPQWQCNLEGAEWVCQNTNETKKRDAIIVLAAKLKGDQDSLDQYLSFLKNPKAFTSVQGKPVMSEVKYAKTVNINDHVWVDALQGDSEIPGFFTRYLATVKADIGVLVTYSINKKKYQEYNQDFESMVKTLKVFRRPGGINVSPADKNLLQNPVPPAVQQDTVFQPSIPGGSENTPTPKAQGGDIPLLFIVLGGVVVAFLIWKRRQSGG